MPDSGLTESQGRQIITLLERLLDELRSTNSTLDTIGDLVVEKIAGISAVLRKERSATDGSDR
jgi:hypothetical protein